MTSVYLEKADLEPHPLDHHLDTAVMFQDQYVSLQNYWPLLDEFSTPSLSRPCLNLISYFALVVFYALTILNVVISRTIVRFHVAIHLHKLFLQTRMPAPFILILPFFPTLLYLSEADPDFPKNTEMYLYLWFHNIHLSSYCTILYL